MPDNVFRAIMSAFIIIAVAVVIWFGWQTYSSSRQYSGHEKATVFEASPVPATLPPTKPTQPPSPTTNSTVTTLPVAVGAEAVLHNGSDEVDVATSQKSLVALVTAAAHQDRKRYDAIFSHGLAFRVPDGTHVTLSGQGTYSGRVKILDGRLAGRTGYVPQEWVATQ